MFENLIIQGTAIVSVGGFAVRLSRDLPSLSPAALRSVRNWWSLGAIALGLHVMAAFQFEHGWKHAAAWEHTRVRTMLLTGWNSGHGLYANYAMTVLWAFDAAAWWIVPEWPQRHRVWTRTLLAGCGFFVFNATAVFGPWYWKWAVSGYVIWRAVRWVRNRQATANRLKEGD